MVAKNYPKEKANIYVQMFYDPKHVAYVEELKASQELAKKQREEATTTEVEEEI